MTARGAPRLLRQGDIVWARLDPVVGHEQAGDRPVVVVSSDLALERIPGMLMIAPLTRTDRGFAEHVRFVTSEGTSFVMCEQTRSVSPLRVRRLAGSVDRRTLDEVLDVVVQLVGR